MSSHLSDDTHKMPASALLSPDAAVALQQTIAALQRAEQGKNEWLIHLNHALRTPLNAIIGYGELLQEEAEACGQKALLPYAQRITRAASHMLTMMKNVRGLIQHDIGQAEFTLASFEVAALVRDVTATIQPALKARHNTFTVHCPNAVGAMRADKERVWQSLISLILQACVATESGTIALDGAREIGQDTPWLVFRVTDTSQGLTDEQVKLAFCGLAPALPLSDDRVWQGLALSRRACRAMRGDITLESAPGAGSTFTMRLPHDVRAAAHATNGPSSS